MNALDRWLEKRPLLIAGGFAFGLIGWLVAGGWISNEQIPFGDGEHYTLRAFTLYGFLHSGQWAQFWQLLTVPRQSLAPPAYWLFFLLPGFAANLASYGFVISLTSYGFLAVAIWELCRSFDRKAWAPALYLLCAGQNVSLDFSYLYFIDGSFFSACVLAMAWQVRAWRRQTWQASLLCGVGIGLLFWIKAANAMLMVAIYFFAELAHLATAWWMAKGARFAAPGTVSKGVKMSFFPRHFASLVVGFIPVVFLALVVCGGYQSIFRLIEANENWRTNITVLQCEGLLRMLYFPLCLTFFYNAELMLLIFLVIGMIAFCRNRRADPAPGQPRREESPAPAFPTVCLAALAVAVFILGEIFSFAVGDKEMRGLLPILPVLWLGVFRLLEKMAVRPSWLLTAGAVYLICAASQVLLNTFDSPEISTEGYQLTGDWLSRFPGYQVANPGPAHASASLARIIRQGMPHGGRVAVGTEQFGLTAESLTWTMQHEPALQGKHSPYEFDNFLNYEAKLSRTAMIGANGILVFVDVRLQYSEKVYAESINLVRYSARNWLKNKLVEHVSHRLGKRPGRGTDCGQEAVRRRACERDG